MKVLLELVRTIWTISKFLSTEELYHMQPRTGSNLQPTIDAFIRLLSNLSFGHRCFKQTACKIGKRLIKNRFIIVHGIIIR